MKQWSPSTSGHRQTKLIGFEFLNKGPIVLFEELPEQLSKMLFSCSVAFSAYRDQEPRFIAGEKAVGDDMVDLDRAG